MFCTKCGKKINEEDRFCANCGAPNKNAKGHHTYDEVVFNPPFKVEAERRTDEILKSTAEAKESGSNNHQLSFDWELDGFPSMEPRKTEDIDFNWDTVVEKRNRVSRENQREKTEQDLDNYLGSLFQGDSEKEEASDKTDLEWKLEGTSEKDRDIDFGEVADTFRMETGEETKREVELFRAEIADAELEKPSSQSEEIISEPMENGEAEVNVERPETEIFGHQLLESEKKGPVADNLNNKDTAIYTITPDGPKDERFYTYNQKRDAFQDLLEKERERIENLESGYKKDSTIEKESSEEDVEAEEKNEGNSSSSGEGKFSEKIGEDLQGEPQEENPSEEISKEEKKNFSENYDTQTQFVTVEAPATTMTVDAYEDVSPLKDKENTEGTVAHEKVAARERESNSKEEGPNQVDFSDSVGSTSIPEGEKKEEQELSKEKTLATLFEEGEEVEKESRHIFAKIMIVILVILLIGEGIILAYKLVDPDGAVSTTADEMIVKAIDFITGREREEVKPPVDDNIDEDKNTSYMLGLVDGVQGQTETIGEIVYDHTLKFDLSKNYGFEEIKDTAEFVDADSHVDENGMQVTYGTLIVNAIAKHYDQWKEEYEGNDLVGINKLAIGEIRTGEKGFYALLNVTYTDANEETIQQNEVVFLKLLDKAVSVEAVKEEER